MAEKEAPVSTNDTSDDTFMGWLGLWILISTAVFAALTPNRPPILVVVYLVTIFCGAAICIQDQRARTKRGGLP